MRVECGIIEQKADQTAALLPFRVTSKQAAESFQKLGGESLVRTNELKIRAQQSAIHGAYLPAWTYDAQTLSAYVGERGEHYWETETYTETENNKPSPKPGKCRRRAGGRLRGESAIALMICW